MTRNGTVGRALSAANGGWVRVAIDDGPPFEVRVRPDERGRLEVVELRLAPGGPIDSTTLRQVQLAHVEALVNAPNLREYLLARLDEPGPAAFDRTDRVVSGKAGPSWDSAARPATGSSWLTAATRPIPSLSR